MAENDAVAEVTSPCVDVCKLNAQQLCIGCWRSIDEIVAWRSLSDAEKREVIARAEQRARVAD